VELADLNLALRERLKELDCLYAIASIIETPGITLEGILEEVVKVLPPAWQYPEAACARIRLDDKEYRSFDFEPGSWSLGSDIVVSGDKAGTLEVFYLEERPAADVGPFLREEKRLIAAVADRLGRMVERVRFEEALMASEERYRDLIENASDLIQSVSPDGRYNYVNRAWREALGYEEKTVTDLRLEDVIHPDDLDHCREAIGKVFAGERATGIEARFICKDGREIRVEGRASCYMEAGKPAYTRGIFRDVTERWRMEEALRESEERFRAIASTAHDAIIVADDMGRVSYWNPAAEQIFGYTPDEALGRNMHELVVAPVYHEQYMDEMSSFRESGEGSVIGTTKEMIARSKDGKPVPIEASFSSLQIGGRWHAVGIARDITERKAAEEIMLAANRELEAFAHTLSHDLRTPLATAFGYARMLENYKALNLDEDSREWLGEISRSLSYMDVMITSLLAYARAGLSGGDSTRVESSRVLEELLQSMKPALEERKLEIEVAEDLPAIQVDAVRLRQVLQNLLDNAIKYGAGTAARIYIGARREGDLVTFHVRDNGTGIPAEKLQSIFDPFVSLKSGEASSGLGIGLSTVKRAVEGWGGAVWAESGRGEGTTFYFTAPAAE
jgi:PAS domain S-box-containing protein